MAEAVLDLAPQLASSTTMNGQMSCWHVAACNGSHACIRLLCRVAPQLLLQREATGATPLAVASSMGCPETVRLLLAAAPEAVEMTNHTG